ncbi:hypothetical protein CXF68_15320 [Tenacibaculum sp. Bg11-29]|uniref:hypothetical protein n=1 Tax=Tenacibaculum sp. Bg11-29 TaxID=2058306 RepID=UPI000C337803|nr:hypothetical protein [Tenacibaculum sp. Bg11-29]PKH51973.1 hypothetical protein CXF68_15320 [Tenacibaculum sp. Bg11-29]
MTKKIILFLCMLFVLMFITRIQAQVTDYGYLIETNVTGYLHANNGEMYVSSNVGFIGSTSFFASSSTVGNVYFNFMPIQDSFTDVTIKVNNTAIRINNFPDCTYEREQEVLKANFNNGILYFSGCSFYQKMYPLHIIDELAIGDNTVCARNTLELSGGYDWQYYIGSKTSPSDGDWKEYASAVTNISVNVGDLYATEGISIIDLAPAAPQRSLKIRTGHKASDKFVSAKTYQVSDCSPEFKEYYNKIKTSCVYNTDGRISLNLGRDIDIATDEKLVVTLFKEDLVNGNLLMGQSSIETNLVNNGGSKYGFVWPFDIDTGKYFFKYQSINKNTQPPDPLPDANDNYWKSLVETPVFEIFSAKNVNFTATKFSDETCVGAKNGEIKLDITSGETSKYKYIIYEVNGTSVTLYRNWTIFTGPTTIIENLEKKTEYRIKIQDTKGCFARKN